jgi:uncharacterized iron-regulated membrane protein
MKSSRFVFLLHSWLGLKFFLVLTVVTLSGTLAVFQEEIDWLVYPQIRVTRGPERIGFDRILASVREAVPDGGIVGQVPLQGAGPRSAIGVVTVTRATGVRRVWVDPYRGVVQGTTPLMTPGYFLAQLHAYLLIPVWGYAIVCTLAFFLLASIITGLMTYKKFWRGFFRRPRSRSVRTLMGDLHRFGGLWSLWFLVVMVATGLWYFWTFVGEPLLDFPEAVRHENPPMLTAAELDRFGPRPPAMLPVDALAEKVRQALPDFDIRYVALPTIHEAPVTFNGNQGELFAPNLSAVHVNPFSGSIVGRELTRDGRGFAYVDVLADAFHFGNFGGTASKVVWFVFGLVMTGLSITGLVIFSRRALRRNEASHSPRRGWSVLKPWGGAMGLLKPLNLVVLAFAAYASVMAIRFYGGGAAAFPARFESQAIGPWRLGVIAISNLGDLSNPIRPGGRVTFVAEYCPGCWADIKRLWVSIGEVPPSTPTTRVVGQPGYSIASLRLPKPIEATTRLWMTAEAWDGERYYTSWPIAPAAR